MNIAILSDVASRPIPVRAPDRWTFHHCTDLPDLQRQLEQTAFALLILDLAKAGSEPGPAIADLLAREHGRSLPVLVLASRNQEDQLVAVLEAGASDYLLLPLRRGELDTRIEVLLKRRHPERFVAETIRIGALSFDPHTLQVSEGAYVTRLKRKEFELALLLFRHAGRPLSRAFMLEKLWPQEATSPSRTLDTHVSRVRTKLRLHPENGYRLSPVYSFGYQLEILGQNSPTAHIDSSLPP